jgi:hypothetical protein
MTPEEKRKSFQRWQEDLEKRLALYLFNTPELEPTRIIEATWELRADGHSQKV